MHQDIEHIMQRTYRYKYSDGLAEITIGGLCVFGALVILVVYVLLDLDLSSTSPLLLVAALALIGATALGGWAVTQAVNVLKERAVYPRTGYVRYRAGDDEQRRFSRRMMWLALALGVLLAPYGDALALMVGLLMGCALLYYARKTGLARFYLEAGLVALTAFALPVLYRALAFERSVLLTMWYLIVVGLLLLIAGGWAFWQYLNQTSTGER